MSEKYLGESIKKLGFGLMRLQIGRASCRERVYPLV